VQQMLKRLIQWFKRFFQRLFGTQIRSQPTKQVSQAEAPPLSDTDLEFLFTELLEGVHQARGQAWAQKWLNKLEHRVSQARWLEWLQKFGDKLLASQIPHNELAARLVRLGELGVGPVGELAYNIGMQLLMRNPGEPIWEYAGVDAFSQHIPTPVADAATEVTDATEFFPEGEYQTLTLEELFVLLQHDGNLRQQLAEELALETDDPATIVQALVNQLQPTEESPLAEN
jgi:hypothetical protein